MDNFDRVDDKNASGAEITLADIPGAMNEIFASLDSDRNNFVSKTELQNARAHVGDHLLLVNIFDENIAALEELSNDEWGDENNGISRGDINILGNKIKQVDQSMQPNGDRALVENISAMLAGRDVRNPKVFGRLLQDYFADLDKDGSGDISSAEVDGVISSTTSTDELHLLSEGLKFNYQRLAEMTNDTNKVKSRNPVSSVTWEDIDSFRYQIDPEHGFNSDAATLKLVDYGLGCVYSSLALCIAFETGVAGALAIANPEPLSKAALVVGTVGMGSLALTSAGAAAMRFRAPAELQKEYDQRKNMLESWSYFRDQRSSRD